MTSLHRKRGHRVSNETLVLVDNTAHVLSKFDARCIGHILVTLQGEDSWKFVPGFIQISPQAPFFFANLAVYPFTVIKQSPEYDYLLSPASPCSESPNLGMVLGSPDTTTLYEIFIV